MSSLTDRLLTHGRPDHEAIVHGARRLAHGELRARAAAVTGGLLAAAPGGLAGAPVAFLAPPSPEYVAALLGIFQAGGMAVPLSPLHTAPEIAYLLENAAPAAVLATADLAHRLEGARPLEPLLAHAPRPAPSIDDEAPALMLYTSGTTGRPKGVVLSHRAVAASCASLHGAWGWRADDRLLHVLPLHHTHGVIVALLGALWAGARTEFASFDARGTWTDLARASVFMAVPTIWAKLMEAFRAAAPDERAAFAAAARGLRLATSGSAALPAALLEEVRAATGLTLLERYGMTEIGMALSNPLDGPRLPGAVGRELPGVTVDIVGEDERPCPSGAPGELRVRSPQLFSGYHGDAAATAAAFDAEGRFRTGDTGARDEAGVVRLLGRTSTDVLKSGGYKLSALEIEDVLRAHPAITEVAVVGAPDPVWGDRVTACVVARPGPPPTLDELQAWARDRLAPYKLPRALVLVDALPRNAMGKVQKQRLVELVRARPAL